MSTEIGTVMSSDNRVYAKPSKLPFQHNALHRHKMRQAVRRGKKRRLLKEFQEAKKAMAASFAPASSDDGRTRIALQQAIRKHDGRLRKRLRKLLKSVGRCPYSPAANERLLAALLPPTLTATVRPANQSEDSIPCVS